MKIVIIIEALVFKMKQYLSNQSGFLIRNINISIFPYYLWHLSKFRNTHDILILTKRNYISKSEC